MGNNLSNGVVDLDVEETMHLALAVALSHGGQAAETPVDTAPVHDGVYLRRCNHCGEVDKVRVCILPVRSADEVGKRLPSWGNPTRDTKDPAQLESKRLKRLNTQGDQNPPVLESIVSGHSPSGKDDILVLDRTPQNLCGGKMAGGFFSQQLDGCRSVMNMQYGPE